MQTLRNQYTNFCNSLLEFYSKNFKVYSLEEIKIEFVDNDIKIDFFGPTEDIHDYFPNELIKLIDYVLNISINHQLRVSNHAKLTNDIRVRCLLKPLNKDKQLIEIKNILETYCKLGEGHFHPNFKDKLYEKIKYTLECESSVYLKFCTIRQKDMCLNEIAKQYLINGDRDTDFILDLIIDECDEDECVSVLLMKRALDTYINETGGGILFKPETDKLKELEACANNGRGLDCVKTLIKFMELGMINEAKACAHNEWDKISNPLYKDIQEILIQIGLYTPPKFMKNLRRQ